MSNKAIRLMSQDHPECSIDEAFWGNHFMGGRLDQSGGVEAYHRLIWQTKRLGCKAFFANGEPYTFQKQHNIYPVFIKIIELESSGYRKLEDGTWEYVRPRKE